MDGFKTVSKNKIENLPKTTGVYCFISSPTPSAKNLTPVYIGKAVNIRDRVKNHFQQPTYRDDLFIDKVNKIGFLKTGSEIEALILEANLIKKYQPKFNVMWRDDKNYFYVAIARNTQKIPYVFITHQIKPKAQNSKPGTIFIGPFTDGTAIKKTLRFLRRIFPYYTSKKHPKNKCAWCHLDLCPGPYEQLIAPRPDGLGAPSALGEYKKNIKKLLLILKGKRGRVLSGLKKEMKTASRQQDYEKAGKTKDKIYALRQVMAHTKVIANSGQNSYDRRNFDRYRETDIGGINWLSTQGILKKIININKDIKRIECYDVSNIQGKQATGSMVVFTNGKPDKNSYRKFHIKIEGKPNDVAMLKEVLERRLNHPEWDFPEIMLIDGGKAQLNTAIKTKEKSLTLSMRSLSQMQSFKNIENVRSIKVMAIAKRRNELYIESKDKPILLKTLPREIFNLILQLRDEAHRFAITYHKKLRKKQLLK